MLAIEVPFCFFQQQKINPRSIKCFLSSTGILFGKPKLRCPDARLPGCCLVWGRRGDPEPNTLPGASPHLLGEGGDTGLPRGHPQKAAQVPGRSHAGVTATACYPKRNFSRYLTGPGFFRGGFRATFGFGGGGGGFFSGRVTVKASSGGWGCRKRGRKCVETCWGRARGLQPRLALPRLLRATYHWRPERGLRCTAEA